MPDQPYTTVHLKNGTTVHLKGQLSPEEIGPKLAAFQQTQNVAQPTGSSHPLPPESMAAKIGSYIPQWSATPLALGKKYLVDPFEKIAAKGGAIGSQLGEAAAVEGVPGIISGLGQNEIAKGIGRGVGETLGSMAADPRNWPLLGEAAARPALQQLMKHGFRVMMAKGTWDAAKDLHDNWSKYTPGQRAELGTRAGLSAGMTAMLMKGKPAPGPEETIIAPGKTEAEAKAETAPISSQQTGSSPKLMTREEIQARIAAIQARRTAKETPTKTEAAKPVEATPSEIAKPTEAPVPEAVKPEVPKPPSAIEQLNAIKAKIDTPERKAATQQIIEDAYDKSKTPAKLTDATVPEQVFRRMGQLRSQGYSEPEQAFTLMKEFPDHAEDIAKAFGSKVGREPAPPEAPKPEGQLVQAAQTPERPGEPVRPAEGPEVERTRIGSDNPAAIQARMDAIAAQPRETGMRDFTKYPYGTVKGDKGYVEPRLSEEKEAGQRLGQRPPIAPKQVDWAERAKVMKERVEAAMQDPKNKGVPKSEIQRRVAEQMRKELGAFGGGGPEDIRGRREEKINEWISQIRDSKSPESVYTQAYNMLKAYGLDDDEIIRRVSGAEGFAETPREERGQPTSYWTDRETMGNNIQALLNNHGLKADPMDVLDRFRDYLKTDEGKHLAERYAKANQYHKSAMAFEHWLNRKPLLDVPQGTSEMMDKVDEIMRRHEATKQPLYIEPPDESSELGEGALRKLHEDTLQHASDVPGVKSPAVEELERMFNLKDERGFATLAALNPFHYLANILDATANLIERRGLSKEEFERRQQAKNVIRQVGAEQARSQLELMNDLDDAIKRHDNPLDKESNFRHFMDAGEGKPFQNMFLNPEDQALAAGLHAMFEDRWDKIKDVKGLEGEGIENYLAHIWEKPNKAKKFLSGLLTGKRPLEGSGRFLKQRFYQYASEGLDKGLTPASWNPVRLQLAALFDMDRFLAAHEIKDRYKDAGLVRWLKVGDYKNRPDGWQRLDDKIFAPKVIESGGLKEWGQYYAPAEVAKIFNNYLSPGLEQNPVFRNVRAYNNALNLWQLGVSGYHGTMISLVSATSDLALGLQKIFNVGDFKGGIRDAFRGTVGTFILRSAAADYKLGRSIQAAAIDPSLHPGLQPYVDLLLKGGARFKQDPFYTQGLSDRRGFMNWLRLAKDGRFFEMATKPVRLIGSPIMEKFVPRVKLGIASRMMQSKFDFMIKQGITDPNTVATEMGKIWDSVDNRAGQMVYDNLFWNKAAKDLSFLAVRAVGWDLGSFREYGGATFVDAPRQLARALRGQRPELTARLAFTIATPITIGLFGGMTHYLMTGKAPEKTEDYFFPGPPGEKVSFPSYMKDYFAFKQHPLQTVVHKLAPTWSQLYDLYTNADFYGTEIYHPGDPLARQGFDILKWYATNWEGIGFKGIQKRVERGEPIGPAATTGMFGFQPVSSAMMMTKAGSLAADLASRQWRVGPRTTADAERHALVSRFEAQAGHKTLDQNEVLKAWQEKKIQDSDLDRIFGETGEPKLSRDFRALNLPDSLAVMREATPDERTQLKPLLLEKWDQIVKYPQDQQQAYDRQIRAYLQ